MPSHQSLKMGKVQYQVIMFFVLTFIFSWSMFIPATMFLPEERQTLLIILGAFGPFVAAAIVIRRSKGRTGLRDWFRQTFQFRIPILQYLAGAFFLPIGIGILQYVLYIVLGGETDSSNAIPWYLYLLYLIPTALLTGGNEEPGWRGFALPAMYAWFHPVIATLILGLVHAAWHIPLLSHYDTTFGWYLFNILPLTFIFNWFYLKSRESIFPIMLFHAGTNVISSFIPTPMDVLDGLGTWMFLRGAVYWVVAITILMISKGRLGYNISGLFGSLRGLPHIWGF
jgi:membrane protease YdiL (CAAX protease family)